MEVRFLADMVSATRDASGRVIAGDSIDATQCAELCTFELQTRQKRSAWLLSATESERLCHDDIGARPFFAEARLPAGR